MTTTIPVPGHPTDLDDGGVLPPAALSGITGRIIMPADPAFDIARPAWNLAVDQRPEFVVQVAEVADIATRC